MKISDGWNFTAIKLNTERTQSTESFYIPKLYGTNSYSVAAYVCINIDHIKRK